jgi:undecaprenyl diphosphate synthase
MVSIKKILSIKDKIPVPLTTKKLPKHIAVIMDGSFEFAEKNKIPIEEICKKDLINVKNITKICIKLNIPIITFYLPTDKIKDSQYFPTMMDSIEEFFEQLSEWDVIHQNQIKISVLGKWYDLPWRVVDSIKAAIDVTKDYDKFFLNLCINYDGQEEIVDACKLIARQITSGKIDPESINKELIKENIYSSYFLPPDLIIKTGRESKLKGLLLWDSVYSRIHFAEKPWPQFFKSDFLKAIEEYQR